MSASAAARYEVRWRPVGTEAWSNPQSVSPVGEIVVEGLDRTVTYEFEVRAVSACGAASIWVSSNYIVPNAPAGTLTLASAQTAADAANAALADIASDNVLSQGEKPVVIRDNNVILSEQAGIDAQATAFGITTEKTVYDSAVTALTTYLATLTAPVLWSDLSGDTTIVGTTFRSNFANVYTARQALLNAIYASAKAKADAAQGTATTATTTATTGLSLATQQGIIDPNFANGLTYWTPDAANQGWYSETGGNSPNPNVTTYAVHAGSTLTAANPAGAQTTALRSDAFIPVTLGELVSATAQIKPVGAPDGYANVRISWRNAAQGEISVSEGSNITTTGGTSRLPPTPAPTGAVYAHVEVAAYLHTAGYYSFTAVGWSYSPSNQSEVPDGGGHHSVTAIDGNGLALIDFSQAGHASKNLGNIADTGTRFAAVQAGADKTGFNTANDTLNVNGTAAASISPIATLMPAQAGADKTSSNTANDTAHVNGATAAAISDGAGRAQLGFDTSGYLVSGRNTLDLLGDSATHMRSVQQAASSGNQIVDNANFQLPFVGGLCPGWDTSGVTSAYLQSASPAPYIGSQYLVIYSSGGGKAAVSLRHYSVRPTSKVSVGGLIAAISGISAGIFATFFTAAGGYLGSIQCWSSTTAWFDLKQSGPVPTGASYMHIELYIGGNGYACFNNIWLTVDDVRVAGSGATLGNQLNAPNSLTLGYGSVRNTTALGAASNGTVAVNAFSNYMGGSTVSYNAVGTAVTGLSVGSTYSIYCHDAGGAGGTKAWYPAASDQLAMQQGDDVVIAGRITIPSSGTSGGGAGGYCVCDSMYIADERTAGEARPGDVFDCLDLPSGPRKFRRRLLAVERERVPCVRITTDAGAVLECSTTTPFDLPDGRVVHALDMLGEAVVTDLGIETVARVEPLGLQPVSHCHLGGVSYAAGADPAHRIYSHNAAKP